MSGVKESVIQNLFPTPIYMNNLDRPFTKQELQFVDNQKNIVLKMRVILIQKIITY